MEQFTGSGHRLLTRAEVAAIFQVSPSTITRWAEAGKLPVVKTLGGHRRYDAAAVQALARQLSTHPPTNQEKSVSAEEAIMTKTVIDVPAMYGDHHVLEVRRILEALPGVQAVSASSAFKAVEIEFNLDEIALDQITAALDEAGYLAPLSIPEESELAVTQLAESVRENAFRHTTAFEQAKDVVSFAHTVPPQPAGRALWPCPGMGLLHGSGAAPNDGQQEVSHA